MNGIRMTNPAIIAATKSGIAHHEAGRLADAEGIYRQTLQLDPGNVELQFLLGLIALQTGKPAAAEEWFGNAIARKKNEPSYHYYLAEALAQQKRYEEAVASYRKAVKLRPNYPEAHCNMG